ncbi:UDP-glycosyltransferase [Winogradskyella sp. J14-2]|uniref:UDP-glycosyltransferase n=1 Tax=Winogradskyella sp. J14-2 TaxID=1936080 RepID=UPI000972DE0F|nr:UDP-glycosyltransferase [Winogradskyella sp. J14-2]APY07540.1 UDP-glycosyltransferase [Winogradskyella sp. J14-2]
MGKPRILVLLTDGVSLRNFAYTSFYKKAEEAGYDIMFWDGTAFDISSLGYKTTKLPPPKLHFLTSVFKNARKHVELNCFARRDKDPIYHAYKFPWSYKGVKNIIRTILSKILIFFCNTESGLKWLRLKTNKLECRTAYYKSCVKTLKAINPDVVYNTSQRSVLAIAPIEAAKALNIKTIGFVFSWDNLPKSTLDVITDEYHVWSDLMKFQLCNYHRFIKDHQVSVTGTPQFEPYYNAAEGLTKDQFYNAYHLNKDYNYLCFSGDDITTSPKDHLYLRDVAKSVRELNNKGHKIGLIFRRCPVDFSSRYDTVLNDFKDVVVPIEPQWKQYGGQWNQIFPEAKDSVLLTHLAKYCVGVINLGSSMAFDFATHHKPCAYLNYHYDAELNIKKGVKVYNYIHFRSQPSRGVVVWLDSPDMESDVLRMIESSDKIAEAANKWFQIVNTAPFDKASERILKAL